MPPAHARQILDLDPFITGKLRSYERREWYLMEGARPLTVLALQQRGSR